MAGTVKKQKGGKKNRKLGRNVKYCTYYRQANIEAKNRLRKMRRHLKKNPNDQANASRFEALGGQI